MTQFYPNMKEYAIQKMTALQISQIRPWHLKTKDQDLLKERCLHVHVYEIHDVQIYFSPTPPSSILIGERV